MSLDHEAIYKAYAETVVSVSDAAGAFDKDGNSVTLEQSKIDAARATIDSDYAKVKYKDDTIIHQRVDSNFEKLWSGGY